MGDERRKSIENNPKYLVNSFDIVRLALEPTDCCEAEPDEFDPPGSGVNVGLNVHASVYLTTDDGDVGWKYQKDAFGDTEAGPYSLQYIGDALGGAGLLALDYKK